jgi:aspartyl-tRNA(Asn)/glutamyl-tRNA(Gln) amidotransferase subunit A
VAVKDNICVKGMPTTCASRILEPYEPPYDAAVVERLRARGALLFGKTNLDEFAMGSSTENSAFAPSRNPHDPARTPGGSSGGSAAAVAAGLAPLALGSDTGGSIRQPAAFCGIVGFKPTYGVVSRYGLVAFASSLDQIGPLARNVGDAALLLEAVAGHDPRDATSEPRPVALDGTGGLEGLRLGWPAEFFGEGLDPEVRRGLARARAVFEGLGAEIREVSLPLTRHGIAVYYIVAPCEASSNLARYDGVRYGIRGADARDVAAMFRSTRGEGFGPEVKRRILLGTFALSSGYYEAYYGRAQRVRAAMRAEVDRCFGEVDLLLTPTTPTPPFPLGEKTADPLAMYLNDVLTVTANLCGLPALSLPCGRTRSDLPVGLQLMGPRFGEATIFRAARAYEAAAALGPLWPPELAA